jgi:hypothetical protein
VEAYGETRKENDIDQREENMKRILLTLTLLLCLAVPSFAFQESITSGEQTADATIYTVATWGPLCFISSVLIITDGTNDAKLIIYDNTANSGTVVLEMTVVGSDNYGGRNWMYPVTITTGIRGDISGTGASYIIEYVTR